MEPLMNPSHQENQHRENDERPWVQVSETFGVSRTEMIIEYLRAQGIQAVAIENRAIGLITGANSTARLMVPEEDVGQALYLLEPDDDLEEEEDSADENDADSSVSGIDKAVLGATAIALNPLGAGIGFVIASTVGSDDDETAYELIGCPQCGANLELSEYEVEQKWFTCSECHEFIQLDDFVICLLCRSELELDADELSRGWYICPECRRAVRLKHS